MHVRLFGWPSLLVSEKRGSALDTSCSNRTVLRYRILLPVSSDVTLSRPDLAISP